MRSLIVLFVFYVVAPPVSFAFVFGGYIKTADDMRFVLIDEKAGISEFVRIGDSFQGHVLLGFDSAANILSVKGADLGTVTHLTLKRSSVKDAHWIQNGTLLTILVRPDGSIAQNGRLVEASLLAEKFQQAAVDGCLHLRITFPPGSEFELAARTLRMLRPAFNASGVLGEIFLELGRNDVP